MFPFKNCITIMLLAGASLSHVRAATYWEEYQARLKKDGPGSKMEAFLQEGTTRHANDPDYYAAAANYWNQVANSVLISTKPADHGDLVIADQKTGRPVGSISTAGESNPKFRNQSIAFLIEGTRRFPWRVDMELGLADLQSDEGNPKAYTETLLQLLSTAHKNPSSLRWMGNALLPDPPQRFIPDCVYNYCARLYDLDNQDADVLCRKLCEVLARDYPDNPKPLNVLAALADKEHKPEECLHWLQKAHAADPKDGLVLMNLATTMQHLGKTKESMEALKKILSLPEADDGCKKEAQTRLDKMSQSGPKSSPVADQK